MRLSDGIHPWFIFLLVVASIQTDHVVTSMTQVCLDYCRDHAPPGTTHESGPYQVNCGSPYDNHDTFACGRFCPTFCRGQCRGSIISYLQCPALPPRPPPREPVVPPPRPPSPGPGNSNYRQNSGSSSEQNDNTVIIVAIVVVSLVVLGAGGFAIYYFSCRKPPTPYMSPTGQGQYNPQQFQQRGKGGYYQQQRPVGGYQNPYQAQNSPSHYSMQAYQPAVQPTAT